MLENSLTLMFHGKPKNSDEAAFLKQALTQELAHLFDNKSAKVTSEKGVIFPDVNFIHIIYREASIDHEHLHCALSRAVNNASDSIKIKEMHTTETPVGTMETPGKLYAHRVSQCVIEF